MELSLKTFLDKEIKEKIVKDTYTYVKHNFSSYYTNNVYGKNKQYMPLNCKFCMHSTHVDEDKKEYLICNKLTDNKQKHKFGVATKGGKLLFLKDRNETPKDVRAYLVNGITDLGYGVFSGCPLKTEKKGHDCRSCSKVKHLSMKKHTKTQTFLCGLSNKWVINEPYTGPIIKNWCELPEDDFASGKLPCFYCYDETAKHESHSCPYSPDNGIDCNCCAKHTNECRELLDVMNDKYYY